MAEPRPAKSDAARCQHCPHLTDQAREDVASVCRQLRGAVEALRKIDSELEQDRSRPAMLARIEEIVADALDLYGGR